MRLTECSIWGSSLTSRKFAPSCPPHGKPCFFRPPCHRPSRSWPTNSLIIPRLLRSEEHTSELQSLMRISYAVFCLKQKKKHKKENSYKNIHNTTHKYKVHK